MTPAESIAACRHSIPPERVADRRIVLVDDDPGVRQFGRAILSPCGYQVLLAADADEAVRICRQHAGKTDLIILDLDRHPLSGCRALRTILQFDPAVRAIFSSSHFADGRIQADGHVIGFIAKPYEARELVRRVRQAFEISSQARFSAGPRSS